MDYDLPLTRNEMELSVMKCMTEINVKANITLTNSRMFMENMTGLLNDVTAFASQTIKDLAIQLYVSENDVNVNEAIMKLQNISNFIKRNDTIDKREKWLIDYGFYIKAEEIPWYTVRRTIFSSTKNSTNIILCLLIIC